MHRPPPTDEAHGVSPPFSSRSALVLRQDVLLALQGLERNFCADLDVSARELRVGIAQLERLPAQFGALSRTVDLFQAHVDELLLARRFALGLVKIYNALPVPATHVDAACSISIFQSRLQERIVAHLNKGDHNWAHLLSGK